MLAEIQGVKLAGVFDVNAERAQQIAAEFGTIACANLDDFLNAVDAITIATTTSTHFDVAKKGLLAGKHVFIEKPITETIEEADELIRIGKDSGPHYSSWTH